jgi:glycosyltransferase involved in cell wall biosynthesis
MNINLIGQRNIFGGGVHYSNFCDAFRKVNFIGDFVNEVEPTDSNLLTLSSSSTLADVHVFFYPTQTKVNLKGFVVKWAIFESNKLPGNYINWLIDSHLIWVPSNWAKTTLIEHGLPEDAINVVPEGVDPTVFHPNLRNMMAKDEVFRFYFCGKKELRKGYPELLQGFKLAFDNDPSVQLILKGDNFWSDNVKGTNKNEELSDDIQSLDLANVRLVSGEKSLEELVYLNSYCDSMIFPSRAEGWGLPLIEAIGCGLPVIANFYSGQTEYLDPIRENITSLDYRLQSIDCPEFKEMWGDEGEWAVASPEVIASALVKARDNKDLMFEKAALASDTIRRDFSWQSAVDKAICSLRDNDRFRLKLQINV